MAKFLNYLEEETLELPKLNVIVKHKEERNDEYYTPAWILRELVNTGGLFDLDPATSEEARKLFKVSNEYYTKETNGLAHEWDGKYVFMNPPFSNPLLTEFCEKMVRNNNGILLVLDKVTNLTRRLLDRTCIAEMRFSNYRMRFKNPDGTDSNYQYNIILYAFGERALKHLFKVKENYRDLGLDPYILFNEQTVSKLLRTKEKEEAL